MFRGGQPYTDFRAINMKDGRIRVEGRPGGVKFEVQPTTITANRTISICDCDGTMFVKGYHMIFGTVLVSATLSLVPAGSLYKISAAVSGLKTTSQILACIHSTVTSSGLAVGAAGCTTEGYLDLYLTGVGASSITSGTILQVAYMALNPQTT